MSKWVLQPSITTALIGIAYGNDVFISIYWGSSSNCIVSSDGINWVQKSLSGTYSLGAITYGIGMFVAVNANANSSYIYSTDNGNTWISPGIIPNLPAKSIIYVKELNLFVAVGGTYVAYSSDITNSASWITRSITTGANFNSIAYGNGIFVAVYHSFYLYTSRDLITWTSYTVSNKGWNTVAYGYGRFVIMAGTVGGIKPYKYTAYSYNGTNWNLATDSVVDNYWISITYGRGTFMGVGRLPASGTTSTDINGNLSISSIDGITWYRQSTGITTGIYYEWINVVFGKGMFVAVSTNGNVKTIMTYSANVATGSLTIPNYTLTYTNPSFSILPNIITNNNNDYTITYSSDNEIVANIVEGNLIIGNTGIANISLTIPSTVDYTSVTATTIITVNPLQSNIVVNSNYQQTYGNTFSFYLNAITNNSETPIVYSSNNPNIADVDGDFVIINGNIGIATITLYQPSSTNFISVTANTVIYINPATPTLNIIPNYTRNYKDLSFSILPDIVTNNYDIPGPTYTYFSNYPLIANVVAGNMIIGNAGTANITIIQSNTINYNSVSANITVTVNKLQASLGYPYSSYTKNYKDLSFNLNANTTNTENTQIVYKTDNSIVANVNAFGNITIGNAGTANITLTGNATTNYNSISANIQITVNKLQANLNYPYPSYTKKYKDLSFNLNANTTNTDSTQISYSTDNPIVANVNATGNVTIGYAGTANITLTKDATTNYNSVTANILIIVNKLQANLNYPANSSLTKNYKDVSFNLNANTTNTDSTEISYSTDNPIVANVNATGNVTIGYAGRANITLTKDATTNYNSVTANIFITVNKLQANLQYPNSSYTKNYKDVSFNLNANTTNTDSTEISYSTDNTNVIIVDTYGNVTIGNAGTANITLTGNATTNYNYVTANIAITVNKIQANLQYPNSSYTKNYKDVSFNLNANTTNTESTQIAYSTDNTNVVIVDTYGNVVIGNAGTANITLTGNATTNYNSVTANISITVNKIQAYLGYPYSSYTKNYKDLSFQLNANTTNTDNTQISYSTNNSSVATVDINGNVIIGNAGTANITLTKDATTNYNPVSANISITVNRLQTNLTFPSSFTKKYKDASFSILSNIATNNTDPYTTRIVTYNSDNSTVANIVAGNMIIGNAGTANIVLTQPQTMNYTDISAVTTITVNRLTVNLTFPSTFTKKYKDASFSILSNIATNNTDPYTSRIVTYQSDNSVVANIVDGIMTIGNAGTAIITLTQPQTTNYTDISAVTTITVNKLTANLTFPSSFTKTYKDGSFSILSNIATNNTDPYTSRIVTYQSDNPVIANIVDGIMTIGNAGTAIITLTQPQTTNYTDISAVTTITVNKLTANLTFPSSFTKIYKDASFSILSNIATNNTDPYTSRIVTYQSDNSIVANIVAGNMIIGNAGTANIILSQPQTTNYTDISAVTTINVNRYIANLTFPSSFTRVYRDASFSILSNIATNNTDPRTILYQSDNSVVANIVAGTMIIGNAGTAIITLTQPQTTNYTDISAVTTITVNRFTANLIFPSTFTKTYKDTSFSILSNIATNNTDPYTSRIVTYQSDNSVVANIVDGTMTIGNAGTAIIVLTQPQTTNYTDISAVTTITVNKLTANLTFPSTFTKTYKDASFSILSNIATNNTDPYTSRIVTYNSDNPVIANIVDGTMTIGNAGTAIITLTQPQTTNYTDISAVTTITVNRLTANLTFPSTFTKTYKDASFSILSNISTNNTDPHTVIYQSNNSTVADIVAGNMIIGNAGTAIITLTQPQTTNYTDISAVTTITVNRLTANLTFPSTFTKKYNDASFSILSNIATNNTDPYTSRIVTYQSDNLGVANIVSGNMIIGNVGTANIVLTQPQTTNYTDISAITTVVVNPFTVTLTFPSTFVRTYKDASFSILSNISTNNTDPYNTRIVTYQSDNSAVANIVDGNMIIGNAGIANIILTQPKTLNYPDISAVTTVIVNRITANLTFPSSFTKKYKDASFSILSNIATNNTDPYNTRIVAYNSDNSNVANIVAGNMIIGNAGTAIITLTQPQTTNYTDITALTTVTVNRITANLTFPSSFTKTYKDASFSILSNIATNNTDPYASRIVTYQSDNSAVANVVDGTMTIGNAGTAIITLTQPQTTNYTDISAVTTITVNRLTANLTFPSTFTKTYKDASFSILSNIATNNTDPYANRVVTYQSDNSSVANIVDGTMIIGNAGTARVVLFQPQTTNYTDISAVTNITVNRSIANLTFPSTFTKMYKDASFSILSNIATNNTDPYTSRIVTYQSDNLGVANIVAGNMIIGNVGTANIILSQPQTANYTDISAVTTVTVNQFTVTLAFPSTFTKTYKDASFSILSDIVTNNTDPYITRIVTYQSDNPVVANIVDGSMIIGNAGTANIILTQPKTANYTDISAITTVTVNRFTADLVVPSSYTRVYKDASFSILSNIATNNTDPYTSRIVTYQSDNPVVANIVAGTVTIGNAGTAIITLTQPQTTNYTSISAVTTITVNRFTANLTFPSSFTKTYKDQYFSILSNIATNNTDPYTGRIVTYKSENPVVANIVDGILTIGNAGTTMIVLTQPQTTNYTDISAVTTITVNKLTANLTFPSSFTKKYKDASFSILSNISTNNTDPYTSRIVTYQSDNSTVADIVAGNMIIGNAGTAIIKLTQPQTTNYTDISAVTTITVNKFTANLTFPSSFTKKYKDASFSILSNIATNNTDPYTSRIVTYQSDNSAVADIVAGNMIIGNAGTAIITLTQPQTTNYTDISAVTTITVNRISANLTFPSTFTKTYKDASFSILSNIATNNTDPYTSRIVTYQSDNSTVANIVDGSMIIGNAGTAIITLTQPQTTNYTDISAITTVTVNRFTANLVVPSTFTKKYKDASFSILSNIATNNTDPYATRIVTYQSNNPVVANIVDGTMTIGNAGTAIITLTQPQTTNYTDISAITTMTVNPIKSNIIVPPSFSQTYGNLTPFNINATSNNPETPVQYTSISPLIATVDPYGNVIIGNVGNTQIQLYQPDSTNYTTFTANTTIYVNRAQPSITVDPSFTAIYGSSPFNIIANITTTNTDSPTLFTYRSGNSSIANVVSGIVTIGNYISDTTITITQPQTSNFLEANTTTSIFINKALPILNYTIPSSIHYKDLSFNLNANSTNTDNQSFIYTSLQPTIVDLTTSGDVVIGNAGTANIIISQSNSYHFLDASVNAVIHVQPLQSNIAIDSSFNRIYGDPNFLLNPTYNNNETPIIYNSSNPTVANVSATGNVTLFNTGKSTITLSQPDTTNYIGISANTIIYVDSKDPTINVDSTIVKTYIDPVFNINARTNNNETPIIYTSGNTSVATIDTTGNITIVNAGKSTITLTQGNTANFDSITANSELTVNPIQTNITVNPSFSQTYGNSTPFNVHAITNNPEVSIVYTSLNPQVATVDSYGNITIGNVGNTSIQITQSETNNYLPITVNTIIYVYQKRPTLTIDASFTKNYLTSAFSILPNITTNNSDPISSISYTYNSTNTDVANVVDGIVTIGNAGNTRVTITQSATANFSDISTNTIIYVSRIQPDINYTASYNKNYQDLPFGLDANTTNTDSPQILYVSDNDVVASVNRTTGNVTIGNAGTANITLTGNKTTNYYPVSANVIITVNKIQSTLGYPESSYTKNYLDPDFPLNANTTNTDSIQILYSTDNTSVATVNRTTGNVTIGNVGTANITLTGNETTNYYPVSANIIVTVNKIPATLGYPYSTYTKKYLDTDFPLNANTTNRDSPQILYSTDNMSVATVNRTTGNITIGNAGTANITLTGNETANYYPVNANIIINVNKIHANLVYPNSSYTKKYLDADFPLNANTTNTDSPQISFSSDNSDVAIVNTEGNVTIGNAGSANITLTGNETSNYLSVNANILVTVNKIQANLGYPNSSYTKKYLDADFPLNANTTNTDSPQISFSTDNIKVATVNTSGNVTIGNVGTANIRLTGNATTNYYPVNANIQITVTPIKPNLIYPNSSYTKTYLDGSFPLNANTTNTDNPSIVYSSDNRAVAIVNTTGNVTIGNAGTANITLTGNATSNYLSVNANIFVTVNRLQANIVYPYSIYNKTYKDDSFQLNANTTNTDNPHIIYRTDNRIVANIDAYGNITIGNAGIANITLTQNKTPNYNEITANIIINVSRIESYISVNPVFIRNYLDNPFNLNASANNTESSIQYASLNPNIANVTSSGIVTIGNAGNTIITMTLGNTTNYSSIITNSMIYVNKRYFSIIVASSFSKIYGSSNFNINAYTSNQETPIQYTSSNTEVASVDSYGNIIIGNVGIATITSYQPETTNYLAVTSTTVIRVNRALPILTIDSSFTRVYGSGSFDLKPNIINSNTDENRIVQYSTSNSSIATVVDGVVTVGNAGFATITIRQFQTTNYLEATTTTLVHVLQKQSIITVSSIFTTIIGDPPFELNATTNNPDTSIIYDSSNPVVASVNNGTIMVKTEGTTTITMTQENTTNYSSGIAETVIIVKPRPPYKIPSNLSIANQFAYGVRSGTYTIKDKTAYPVKYTPVFSKITGELKQRPSKF